MAGIYFHIPFCKQACHYCDFHFSTNSSMLDRMLLCMKHELSQRSSFFEDETVETIYFGGGTPSLLEPKQISELITHSKEIFQVCENAEITLEVNPDDLTSKRIEAIRDTPVNRFSVGVQSFFEEDLRWMNRAHNAADSLYSVQRLLNSGYDNLSIDLIYGYPMLSDEKWLENLIRTIDLGISHISAYSMTVEPRTALDHAIKHAKQAPMDEEQSARQFTMLTDIAGEAGYQHYEISNLAKPGFVARHNSNYWLGVPYLGIGPSAHSYRGRERSWNISNNTHYMKGIEEGTSLIEKELLSPYDQLNEYIMTSLRTIWGLDLNKVEQRHGFHARSELERAAQPGLEQGSLVHLEGKLILTKKGRLIADRLAADLFFEQLQP